MVSMICDKVTLGACFGICIFVWWSKKSYLYNNTIDNKYISLIGKWFVEIVVNFETKQGLSSKRTISYIIWTALHEFSHNFNHTL